MFMVVPKRPIKIKKQATKKVKIKTVIEPIFTKTEIEEFNTLLKLKKKIGGFHTRPKLK